MIGKSRHWRDVIRILTKGQTDRLSAESMLKYFHPLEMWLKVQNRKERIVGWNIIPEDTALYRPMELNASNILFKNSFHVVLLLFTLVLHCF